MSAIMRLLRLCSAAEPDWFRIGSLLVSILNAKRTGSLSKDKAPFLVVFWIVRHGESGGMLLAS
jgi:hypothetical protein